MAQRVITQGKRVQTFGPSPVTPFDAEPSTLIGKALADGWSITHLSTAIMGEFHLTTVVVEKPDASNMELG